MNLSFLISILKGSNVFETVAKILNIAAGFLANNDADKLGTDDLAAGVLSAAADGLKAYGVRDTNEHGNIVDGVIAGLQEYREEMVQLGRIVSIDRTPIE